MITTISETICMRKTKVYDCTMIELDKHHSDRKGNITVVENNDTIPFGIKRTYYLEEKAVADTLTKS